MYGKLALGNIKKSIRNYGVYFLTLVFGVCVFYGFNSITQQNTVLAMSESQNKMLDLLSTLISGVSVFIAVILGFLIVYASRYLIRRRKQEFGTYLLLGMPPAKVSRIIVYETFLVGALSLVVGLIAGILLSQALLYVTAMLFTITIDELVFLFSWEALIMTVGYFGVMFLIALAFNALTVSRYKLIDLINANRKNEGFKLRSLPLSIVLFIISLVLIGVAYALLTENALREFDEMFFASTIIVIIGTFLFFYSLAGFLLRAIQTNKRLYLRGLNMFTLRQLNAKINTAFASISLVCMALFLALTSSCGGFALSSSFNANLEASTRYDATLKTFVHDTKEASSERDIPWMNNAEADNFDMAAALQREVPEWDTLVKDAAQISTYSSGITFGQLLERSEAALSDALNNALYMDTFVQTSIDAVALSDFNSQRALLGLEPLTLADDEYLLWCDFEELKILHQTLLDQGETLNVFGSELHPSSTVLETFSAECSSTLMNMGIVVVADRHISADLRPSTLILNIMYNGEREAIEPLFMKALDAAYGELWAQDTTLIGWPYMSEFSAVQVYDQSVGLTAVITYLAIYLGFILLITCAAILALQQLTEAADNVSRYALLQKLGVEKRMLNKALFWQIGIYFIFPLILAVAHSAVALNVVVGVVSLYGHLNILEPLLPVVAMALVVYGGYFLVTYFASRGMVTASKRQAA